MSAPGDLGTWLVQRGEALRRRIPKLTQLQPVVGREGLRVELTVGSRSIALGLRPRDEQPAYAQSPLVSFGLDLGTGGPLDAATEEAARTMVAVLSRLAEEGWTLPRPGSAPGTGPSLTTLFDLPAAEQISRLRREGVDGLVVDLDRGPVPASLEAGTPPRVVHLVGRAAADPAQVVAAAKAAVALGARSVHAPLIGPDGAWAPAFVAAGVRRVWVPWAGDAPMADWHALAQAGLEVLAVATSLDAVAARTALAGLVSCLVLPTRVDAGPENAVPVVVAGLPRRSEGHTYAFAPITERPAWEALA